RGHIASAHPEWLMVPRPLASSLSHVTPRSPAYLGALARWTHAQSAQVEGLYLSPVTAESQDYTASVIREIVEKDPVDGIHFDYIRYPSAEFDYSPSALALFRAAVAPKLSATERQRLDRAAATDVTAWADALASDWASFRRDRLTQLARR